MFGQREVQDYEASAGSSASGQYALEKLVGRIANDAEQRFLAEAVACLQVSARRAAVVMIWLLTVDHLQHFVLSHKLAEWAARPDNKGRKNVSKDGPPVLGFLSGRPDGLLRACSG